MNYAKIAIGGTIFVFIASIFTNVLAYVFRLILARNLTVAEYGLFYAVFSLVSLVLYLRDLGLNKALVKYIAEYTAQKKLSAVKTAILSVFTYQIGFSLVIAFVLYLLAEPLATYYFKDAAAKIVIEYFFIYIVLSAIVVFQKSVMLGFKKIKTHALAQPLRLLVATSVLLVLITMNVGVTAPILAHIVGWIATIILFISAGKDVLPYLREKITDVKKINKSLFTFGFAAMFTNVGSRILSHFDTLLLTYVSTLQSVGVYNVVLPSALLFSFIGSAATTVLFPLMSDLWAQGKKKEVLKATNVVYHYALILLTPLLLGMAVYADVFLTLFFGEQYATGANALRILLIGMLFFLVAKINHEVLAAMGKPGKVTQIFAIAVGVNVVGNLILIPIYDIEGAAFATAISYMVTLVLSFMFLRKQLAITPPVKQWMLTLLTGGFYVLILTVLKSWLQMNIFVEIVVVLSIAGILYLGMLYLLRLINIDEIKYYANQVMKK